MNPREGSKLWIVLTAALLVDGAGVAYIAMQNATANAASSNQEVVSSPSEAQEPQISELHRKAGLQLFP